MSRVTRLLSLAVLAFAFAQNPLSAQATVVSGPDSTRGDLWFQRGVGFDSSSNFRDAANAYGRAAVLGFQPLASQLRAARAYMRSSDTAKALAHLREASAFGFAGALIDSEPAFAPLRTLAEYSAIRTSAEAVRYPCRGVHSFDFWAGTFDVTPWSQPNARSSMTTNTRRYDGCVIIEEFDGGARGTHGMSMSFYDVNRHVWRMVWNDDQNGSNDFEGEVRDGAMHFLGWVLDAGGKRILASNTLAAVGADTVRQTYATSSDSGKTWIVQNDGRYVRRPRHD